jgi:tetratricopeptide (TPR) repeat protein
MTKCKCWVAVLIAVLLLPNVAASADPAKEAFEKGKSCLDKKHYDAAITAFTEAILLNPKDAVAYGNRGIAYRHKAKYDEAIADYTEAIRLNPKDAKAYNNRGLAYHALGMNGNTGAFDKAVADFTEYIRLDPKNAKAYKNRGFSYHERGLASEETGDLAMFMELVDRDNMGGRSIALKHKDQLDKAIADFTEFKFRTFFSSSFTRWCLGRLCVPGA